MTTPRVTELPRRLEPVGRDTFLAAASAGGSPALLAARLGERVHRPGTGHGLGAVEVRGRVAELVHD